MMTIKNYEKFYKLECNTLLYNTLLRTDGTLLIEPKKKERKKERHVTTRRLLNFINTEYMPGRYLSIH